MKNGKKRKNMDLSNYQKILENRVIKEKPKGIYSYQQGVVKEICDYFGSYKEFGLWSGVCKKIGAGELKAKLDYIKGKGIKSPNYLLVCTKK